VKNKPLIIVAGEPYSIFSEIFYKIFKSSFYKKYKIPIILIGSKNIIEMQMKKMKYSYKINLIKKNEIENAKLNNFEINLIDVKLKFKKPFGKITNKSSKYIKECFEIAINIMKKKLGFALINGPVSKTHFLHGKYNGITEYLSHKTYKKNDEVMLIYNKLLSVCPITTHIPLKNVSKRISSNEILKKITTINKFYKTNLKKIPKFAVTGLNPHCESNFKNNEENKIIKPAIKRAQKKNLRVTGPFPADTLFTKNNIKKFDVVIGMYHDQVITPLKTLYNFNAINITLGLPFIRISPDHGTNNQMLGKKKSDPTSLKEALLFLKKINEN
jgi:4-hydroxythreonine-4-phosphate dehydrogenase